MDKYPIYVDASCLKSDSLCDRRFLNHIIRSYTGTTRLENYKAGYGTAFHEFLRFYYNHQPAQRPSILAEATNIATTFYSKHIPYVPLNDVKEFRTGNHLTNVCQKYHQHYGVGDMICPLDTPGGEKCLETKFCIPYYEGSNFIIFLAGTVDMVADYRGKLVIVDHKSTGAYKIDDFFKSFEMNIQTQFYVRNFKEFTKMSEYVPIVINGIFIKKCTIAAEKKGDFDGVTFQRSPEIEYTPSQMTQFENYLTKRLKNIIQLCETYPFELDMAYENLGSPDYAACESKFSRCIFFDVCKQPTEVQIPVLKSRFQIEKYDPMHFND